MRTALAFLLAPLLASTMPGADDPQARIEAWDRGMMRVGGGIANGFLHDASWSKDGSVFSCLWTLPDGTTIRRNVRLPEGTVVDQPREATRPEAVAADVLRRSWQEPRRSRNAGTMGWKGPGAAGTLRIDDDRLMLLREGEAPRPIATAPAGRRWSGPPSWSPDGSKVALWHELPVRHRTLELPGKDGQVRRVPYPVAGDPLAEPRPHVIDIAAGKGSSPDPELTGPVYESRGLDWSPDGKRLLSEWVRRGFTGHGILAHESGAWRRLRAEEPGGPLYVYGTRHRFDLDDGTTLWGTERTGHRHLERVDLATGRTVARVTDGAWQVRALARVDAEAGLAWVEASGFHPGENPHHAHLLQVRLDGKGRPKDLTPGDAHHEVAFSPCGRWFLHAASRADLPPTFALRRMADGEVVATLGGGDDRRARAEGWAGRKVVRSKDRDGRFDIWGVVHFPHPFDPAKRYPVVEKIYAGPHGAHVPHAYAPWWESGITELAQSGFFVVQCDARGTFGRGRAFQSQAFGDLADSGLPDRIAWIREAGARIPQMDLSRVGIYGGSAGGQSTVWALLRHGDFYRVGVADCGCHDNRMDKLWWNEQWLGWPVGPAYDRNRCANEAHRLAGPLLLTVGEADDNVDPRSTLELAEAFRSAGKSHLVSLEVVRGAGHGAGELPGPRVRRVDFFRTHLGGPR